jgi:hypothetical protein
MTEVEWVNSYKPIRLLHFLEDKPSARKFRLFAVACCHQIWDLIVEERSRRAVNVAERMADEDVSEDVVIESTKLAFAAWPQPGGRAAHCTIEKDFKSGGEAFLGPHSPLVRAMWTASFTTDTVIQATDKSRWQAIQKQEGKRQAPLVRDIFGNPFRPVSFSPEWRTDTAVALVRQMYESRDFGAMPILADALQDAGCDNVDLLAHCRGPGPHVRGCWVVDLVLGKEEPQSRTPCCTGPLSNAHSVDRVAVCAAGGLIRSAGAQLSLGRARLSCRSTTSPESFGGSHEPSRVR